MENEKCENCNWYWRAEALILCPQCKKEGLKYYKEKIVYEVGGVVGGQCPQQTSGESVVKASEIRIPKPVLDHLLSPDQADKEKIPYVDALQDVADVLEKFFNN